MVTKRFLNLLFVLLMAAPSDASDSGTTLVVLTSNLKPYQEALNGVRNNLAPGFSSVVLSEKEPEISGPGKTVIAIGGKAAAYSYPMGTRLIYCLAPGLKIRPKAKQDVVRILTSPSLLTLATRFKDIQPSLKRLGVIWISASIEDYLNEKEKIFSAVGVKIISYHMESPDDLPNTLRYLNGKVDALWLPPDPALISDVTISIINEFSWANHIPLYVPTDGLVVKGAVGSVWSSFEEIGHLAAQAARLAPKGNATSQTIYPHKIHTTLNLTAAKKTGMKIPSEVVKTADRIVP